MQTQANEVTSKKQNTGNTEKKVNNGEGVKLAFENAMNKLPEKLDGLWEKEGGKKFLSHLMFSFLPINRKEVFQIGNFDLHKKYNDVPKICALTGFAVADVTFSMDEVTKNHFQEKGLKVNKLVFNIPCVGSTESTKMVSTFALNIFNDWVLKALGEGETKKSNEINKIITAARRKADGTFKVKTEEAPKKKKVVSENTKNLVVDNQIVGEQKPQTYTMGDKFDFSKLKFND
jgi:hypothetical protein